MYTLVIMWFVSVLQVLQIYMQIRVLVTSYLFLSGYGHFHYFWNNGDYSFVRFCTVSTSWVEDAFLNRSAPTNNRLIEYSYTQSVTAGNRLHSQSLVELRSTKLPNFRQPKGRFYVRYMYGK